MTSSPTNIPPSRGMGGMTRVGVPLGHRCVHHSGCSGFSPYWSPTGSEPHEGGGGIYPEQGLSPAPGQVPVLWWVSPAATSSSKSSRIAPDYIRCLPCSGLPQLTGVWGARGEEGTLPRPQPELVGHWKRQHTARLLRGQDQNQGIFSGLLIAQQGREGGGPQPVNAARPLCRPRREPARA